MFFHKLVCAKKKKFSHFGGNFLELVATNKVNSFAVGAYFNGLTIRQFERYSDFLIGQHFLDDGFVLVKRLHPVGLRSTDEQKNYDT